MPVVGHVPDAVGYAAAMSGGQRTVEHLDDWLAEAAGTEPFSGFDSDAGEAALELLTDDAALALATDSATAGVTNVPTLTVWDQLGQADSWDFDDPRLATVHRSVKQQWRSWQGYLSADDIAWFATYTDALCEFTATLHDAGAPLALGTDVINPFVFPGDSVHQELALLESCGLTPEEALALATTGAAEALDQRGLFGTIATGARADLLLLDADPLQDLSVLQEPVGVMARGDWFTAEALDAAVQEVADSYR